MSPFGKGGGAYATCYCLCATPPAPSVALIPSISPVIACLSCRDLYSPSLPFRSDLFLPSPTHSFPFAFGKLLLPSPQSCVYAVQHKHTQSVFTHTPEPTKTRCCGSPAVSLGCCSAPASTAHWLCSEQSWHCHRTSECVSGPTPSAQCSPVATCPATTPSAPVCVSWSVLCCTLLWFVYR